MIGWDVSGRAYQLAIVTAAPPGAEEEVAVAVEVEEEEEEVSYLSIPSSPKTTKSTE